MSLLDLLNDKKTWNAFWTYKTNLACPKAFAKELRRFIDEEAYLPAASAIACGEPFPIPKRSVISKLGSEKKRVVYTYPEAENTVLKFLTYEILRKYNAVFSDCLYSFRPGRTAKDGIRKILRMNDLDRKYFYKADIHDYFNSVPVEKLLPMLQDALQDDEPLFRFLSGLLTEKRVLDHGSVIEEEKGIMAGTPVSSFFANLYLKDLDEHFESLSVPYLRYSDDLIVFSDTEAELNDHISYIRSFLADAGLSMNPKKECTGFPGEPFTFLGFSYQNGTVDIAKSTVTKLKQKMRRKTRALMRWQKRNGTGNESAAKAFIRIFNRKLLLGPKDNELTWSYWFFPVINTTESLHEIDRYAEDCVRYLLSGTRTKSRFNVRYEDLKALGFRSLVHEYWKGERRYEEKNAKPQNNTCNLRENVIYND